MGKHCGRLEPGHLENVVQEVIILLRISFRGKKPTIKEEIFGKKIATTTLNALHLTNLPHLCENDT